MSHRAGPASRFTVSPRLVKRHLEQVADSTHPWRKRFEEEHGQQSGFPSTRPGRRADHHEFTLRTRAYCLTRRDFGHYSAAMEEQLSALEDRIRQVVELCQQLRAENKELRQDVAQLNSENKRLSDKITHAKERLQGLLEQIPE
jgi:cell division protein ZapB